MFRLWLERAISIYRGEGGFGPAPVLLVGATDEAEAFIMTSTRDRQSPFRVVGVIDSGTRPVGSLIRGVSVLGAIADIDAAVSNLTRRDMRPEPIILSDPDQIRRAS